MSKGTRSERHREMRSARDAPRHKEYNARGLRVIQGGRAASGAGVESGERAQPRHREPPGRVKRKRRIAVVALCILAVGLITYVLLGPVTRVIESRRNLSRVEVQLAEEQSRTAVLEERKAWDMTERFVEWEARKMGYVKPGEIPIIVLDYQEDETTSDGTTDVTSP